MPFIVKQECRCCQKRARTGDMWHCEDCWNKHHHGLRDKDWIPEKEFRERDDNNGYLDKRRYL